MAGGDTDTRQHGGDARIAAGIGGDGGEGQVGGGFAVAAGVAAGRTEELDTVSGAGVAIEAAGDGGISASAVGACQHGVVLKTIVTRVGIADIVGRDAVCP